MKKYTTADARQRFAEILEQVESGKEVAMTRHGKWIATLSKKRAKWHRRYRPSGGWSGK